MPENMKKLLYLMAVMLFSGACTDDSMPRFTPPPEINEFVFLPPNPDSGDQVNIITYDCKYNVLASINVTGKDIVVKKRYNSQMKLPCILNYDTISLGRLKQGTYLVTLLVIDTNHFVKDSVSIQETKTLKVGK